MLIDYPVYINYLFAKAGNTASPLSGTFELTPRCTLDCKMCYIHRRENDASALQGEKSTEWWLDKAKTAAGKGMLILLLTGGEPLLRKDFDEIYSYCRSLGVLMNVNTNGTLLTDDKIKLFSENKPQRVNITLYGASRETYQSLCGRGEAFDAVHDGILKLKEAGVNVKLNYSVTPLNRDDMNKAFAFSKKHGIPLQAVTYMYPPVRVCGGTACSEGALRLNPEEAAHAQFNYRRFQLGDEGLLRAVRLFRKGDPTGVPADECTDLIGEKIRCRAGYTSFWITWDGIMRPCGMMTEPGFDASDFEAAWQAVRAAREKIIMPAKCLNCDLKAICDSCAAATFAETGRFDGVPSYLCEKAQIYNEICKEFADKYSENDIKE